MSHDFTAASDETDAVDFLIGEHRAVEGLFARFEDLRGSGDLAAEEALVADIVRELRVHAEIEEAVFYPAIRKALAQGEELADEALSEHQEVKDSLVEIEEMAADEPRFEARVTTLINDVRHHVNEEESGILVKLRLALGELTLRALGGELQAAKQASMSGHDPSVLRELPFPDPQVLEEADTTLTLTPAATPTKSSVKKRGSSKAPAKATGTQARKRGGLVTYRVEPAARGWRVVKQGATRASATSDTKPAAVARGRELARRQSRGRLIVKGKDGRVQEEVTYGDRADGGRKSA